MLIPVSREAFLPLLLLSFVIGLFLGAVYDLLRIRRVAFRLMWEGSPRERGWRKFLRRYGSGTDTVLCFFEDLLFCLFGTVVLILMNFKLHYGLPRWYSYGTVLGGFFLYRATLGRIVMQCSEAILRWVYRVLRFFKRRMVMPVLGALKKAFLTLRQKEKRRRALAYTDAAEAEMLTLFQQRSRLKNDDGKDAET